MEDKMTQYYLELNQNSSYLINNSDVIITSGVNNALPCLFISDLTFNRSALGVNARFSGSIYYSLNAKNQDKQAISYEQYYLPEDIVKQLGNFDVSGVNTFNIIDNISLMLCQYLKTLKVIFPNGDITENFIFENWTIKTV
jgi:hypothetical protein